MPKVVTNPMPAELAEIIATHRALFGGFTMMAEEAAGEGQPGEQQPTGTPATPTPKGDEQLGDAGKKALQSERDARKSAEQRNADLQSQIDALKPLQDQMTRLTEAFGAPKGASTEDVVGQLQSQMAALQHDNLVNAVARAHHVESDDDIELLRTAKDRDHMEKLAARLATPAAAPAPGTPQPDPSVGRSGGKAEPTSLGQAISDHYS